MAKFDVYRLRDGKRLILDCQADVLRDFSTRFVVPLIPMAEAPKPAARLNPMFELDDTAYMMATQFALSIPVAELATVHSSLRQQETIIGNAIDMLISGF